MREVLFSIKICQQILSEKVHWSNQSKQSFKLLSHHATGMFLNKITKFEEKNKASE